MGTPKGKKLIHSLAGDTIVTVTVSDGKGPLATITIIDEGQTPQTRYHNYAIVVERAAPVSGSMLYRIKRHSAPASRGHPAVYEEWWLGLLRRVTDKIVMGYPDEEESIESTD